MIDLKNIDGVGPVMDLPLSDSAKCKVLNLSSSNKNLTPEVFNDMYRFNQFINEELKGYECGIGGYLENRSIYQRSSIFKGDEARSLHLGIDIWAPAHSEVFAPIEGKVHSFADNADFGDYGPTIILEHKLEGELLYSLYGHLSKTSLIDLYPGKKISLGDKIASLGEESENVGWPPHLHFQLMKDMQDKSGDYPGVCKPSEKESYQAKCPNPNLVLRSKLLPIT